MNESELKEGWDFLENLSQGDYHESLAQILAEGDDESRILRVGRLIGVSLKMPFAVPEDLSAPSSYTGSHRGWNLVDESAFESPERKNTWQYQTLQALSRQEGIDSPYRLAMYAHYERGFFGFLALSFRKLICSNPKLLGQIKSKVAAGTSSGQNIQFVTPDFFVGAGGVALGAFLVNQVPAFGYLGAPAIAGLVVLLYSVGVDAFCQWTATQAESKMGDAEKH
ncbi:MAG: hypothetical protein ABJC10_14125 [Acidobacteriota bacterium]